MKLQTLSIHCMKGMVIQGI